MNTKQLVKKLMKQISHEYIISDYISDESLQLAIKLAQSLETPEERQLRLQKFSDITGKALIEARKYSKVKYSV